MKIAVKLIQIEHLISLNQGCQKVPATGDITGYFEVFAI